MVICPPPGAGGLITKSMEKLTKEQIDTLKKKHGEVFLVEAGEKACVLKRPDRKVLSAAVSLGQSDPMKYNEVILKNCWIAGDEEIQTDDSLFLGVSAKLSELVEVKEATLKKL